MRCKDFDAQIEELLAGILHPDASQHMLHCERCTSYFRARSAVQSGLGALASAPVQGPSRATDRAVMESYRRLQQGRGNRVPSPSTGRLIAFPGHRALPPAARSRWSGLAVAAALLAMVGSGIHLWMGAPTVSAPSIASAPAISQSAPAVADSATPATESALRNASPRQLQAKLVTGRATRSATAAAPVLAKAVIAGAEANDAGAIQNAPMAANPIMHLASAGGAAPANGVGQPAGSTWPGYSDLMYCDPVVCSGPMQVVRIKVPVGQMKPGAGKSESNSFVNAEVVVGPDGVARAIRVGN